MANNGLTYKFHIFEPRNDKCEEDRPSSLRTQLKLSETVMIFFAVILESIVKYLNFIISICH